MYPTTTRIKDAKMWYRRTPSAASEMIPRTTSGGEGNIGVPVTTTTAHQMPITEATTRYGASPRLVGRSLTLMSGRGGANVFGTATALPSLGKLYLRGAVVTHEAVVYIFLIRHLMLQHLAFVRQLHELVQL